jgi:hypothetical protein
MATLNQLLPSPIKTTDQGEDSTVGAPGANLTTTFNEMLSHACLIPQNAVGTGFRVHLRVQESGGGSLTSIRMRLMRSGVAVEDQTSVISAVSNATAEHNLFLIVTGNRSFSSTDILGLEITLIGTGAGRVFTLHHNRESKDMTVQMGRYQ